MTNDVDTLATALYATTDDMLKEHPDLAPWRPPVGITPRLSDAELVTLATMQAILGYTSEAKWLRHARAHLRHLFPHLPQQPGYNKRLRKAAGLMRSVNRILATTTSVWSDGVWVVDSAPVECGRSRETVKRSDLAGWAEYGYCASQSRFKLPQLAELGPLPHGYIRPEDGYSSGVVDGEDSESGLIRRRPWELVASTVRWELFGLAACGVVTLVSWPFGWLPDSTLLLTTSAMFAAGPVSELYRTRPPRRLAGVAALVATMTVTMLFGAAADSAFPPLADHDIGLLAGLLVGAPASAGAATWFFNRANVA